MWIGIILLLLVAFDASAFVCYITRFTEENFATLIAVIFIIKAFEKTLSIGKKYPIDPSPCFCEPKEVPEGWDYMATTLPPSNISHAPCSFEWNIGGNMTTIKGHESVGCHYVPNAFLMSCLIFIGTFLISHHLKQFKLQNFFPTVVRSYISDFAVVIAIFSMTIVDMMVGVDTPKLSVPNRFAPTLDTRGWVVPLLNGNPIYPPILAAIPAVLGSILIFMNKQDRAAIVVICSTVGLSTPILSKIPMPVLYEVFLYMDVASLNGLQFFDRILPVLITVHRNVKVKKTIGLE